MSPPQLAKHSRGNSVGSRAERLTQRNDWRRMTTPLRYQLSEIMRIEQEAGGQQ